MAQYLDNDEDRNVDNKEIIKEMINANSALLMWKSEEQLDDFNYNGSIEFQDLGNDETIPEWHSNGFIGEFDASLEEVLHLITHTGYANAYPEIFGENPNTELANLMDNARGGHFIEIPDIYPTSAWYTYYDETCDYSCMLTEYIYWSLTSILGAQKNRSAEIAEEWKLYNRDLVSTRDEGVFKLLTDQRYKLPTKLPDGSYRASK